MEKQESKFIFRTYAKAELASLYFPKQESDTAERNLRRWIQRQTDILKEFDAIGYNKKLHSFRRQEVEIIVKYLGEP